MPEGDTLRKHANRINKTIKGQLIKRFDSRSPRLCDADLLARRILFAEARGKHLLIHVESRGVVHLHFGREGALRIRPLGRPSSDSVRRNFLLETDVFQVICVNAPIAEILSQWQLIRHPSLSKLGPDILDLDVPINEILLRLRRAPQQSIGVALLDQRICCGIGNIYKSEMLFRQGVNPFAPVESFDDDTLESLLSQVRLWMARNIGPGRRRTRWERGPVNWVYRRSGDHCLRCDGFIEVRRQGMQGRTTYFCRRCQRVAELR